MKRKPLIPKDVDPIELADEMKMGLTKKFIEDIDNLRKIRSRLAKRS